MFNAGTRIEPLSRRLRLLWVIFDRDEARNRSRPVGCAAETGSKIRGQASTSMGRSVLRVSLQTGASNHALRAHRPSVGDHQADAAE
jgi:hypothetical protein